MGDFMSFIDNIERLNQALEQAEQAVAAGRRELPQKGIRGLMHKKGLSRASRELNKMDQDIRTVASLLRQYQQMQASGLHVDMQEATQDLVAMTQDISDLVTKRVAVAKKATGLMSQFTRTKEGAALQSAKRQESSSARKYHQDVARLRQKLAPAATGEWYLSRYQAACKRRNIRANNPFYFEKEFWTAFNDPDFTEFAEDMLKRIKEDPKQLVAPVAGGKNFLQSIDDLVKKLNFPWEAGQLIVPFYRLLALKMNDPVIFNPLLIDRLDEVMQSVTEESMELHEIATQEQNVDEKKRIRQKVESLDQAQGMIGHFMNAVEGIKYSLDNM